MGWGDRWRMWERRLRAVLCWVVFFTMIAFYLPVVTAIQALLQVCLLQTLCVRYGCIVSGVIASTHPLPCLMQWMNIVITLSAFPSVTQCVPCSPSPPACTGAKP